MKKQHSLIPQSFAISVLSAPRCSMGEGRDNFLSGLSTEAVSPIPFGWMGLGGSSGLHGNEHTDIC